MKKHPRYVIVVGASAGGLKALMEMVGNLPEKMDAAVVIVLHLSAKGISGFLADQLQRHTTWPCKVGERDLPLESNCIYVGPPDFHIMVTREKILVGEGAKENRWRPSIDVLFRSSAAAFNTHAVGVILTGLLDDGAAGMLAIKRSGGITIVQDPNEAEYADMPVSVLNITEVNYCVPVADMGSILSTITQMDRPEIEAPPDVIAESEISTKNAIGIENIDMLGNQSIFACPDCGGGLWHIQDGNVSRYRCYVGHSYTERDLFVKQAETLETTLWVALRMMEERKNMLKRLRENNLKKGFVRLASENQVSEEELEVHINKLKELLFATNKSMNAGTGTI